MKKLQPIFQLINAVLLDQLRVHLHLGEGDGIHVNSSIARILLGQKGEAKDEQVDNGLTVEDLQVGVEDLQLPQPGSPGVSLTLRVDNVTLLFAPAFWPRAAALAKEPLVGNLGRILDRIHLRNLKVKVSLDPNKILDVEVWLEHQEITLAGKSGITVDDVHLTLEGLDLKEKNKKVALKASRVVLYSVTTKVSGDVLNRGVDVARKKIPPMVQSIDFDLSYERMLVTTKLSVFPLSIPTELTFMANQNQFGIYIVKVAVGMARPVILGIVNTFAKNKPEINVVGDKLFINIWGKLPVPVVCNLETFAISDGKIVVAFAPPAHVPDRPGRQPVAVEHPAPAEKTQDAESWTQEEGTAVDPAPPAAALPPLP